MAIPFNFELFKKRLNLFLEKIEDLGGEVEPLMIEKPATEEEVKAVEAQLGYTLPPHFREVLLENTAHLEFYWDVNDVTIEDESIISSISHPNSKWAVFSKSTLRKCGGNV